MPATDAFRTPAAAPTYGHLNTASAGLDGGNRSMIPLSDAARIPLPDLAEMLRIRLQPTRVDPPGGLAGVVGDRRGERDPLLDHGVDRGATAVAVDQHHDAGVGRALAPGRPASPGWRPRGRRAGRRRGAAQGRRRGPSGPRWPGPRARTRRQRPGAGAGRGSQRPRGCGVRRHLSALTRQLAGEPTTKSDRAGPAGHPRRG
jgi:hypothetical protein